MADADTTYYSNYSLSLVCLVLTNLDNILKSRNYYLTNKGPSSQSYGFSSGHVWMRELDHKEG